jgi:anti-anti-sigma factor
MLGASETTFTVPEGVQVDILIRKEGQVRVVSMSGRLTFGEAGDKLGAPFRELIDSGDRRFVFHMADVPYVDSAGIAELVACAKRAYERGGVVKVVSPSGSKTRRVFALTGLEKVFEVFDTEGDAIGSFPALPAEGD